MEDYKIIFQNMIERLKEKKAIDIINVYKAFETAEKLHANQFRKAGDPYILHPVRVAEILERLDFNTNVIAGALLHDTVEDCGYTIEEIKKDFNPTIAKIVDGVTAIESKDTHKTELTKMLEEELTFQKLISIGKENLYAFFIKFADRLHNLTTISSFPVYKQLAKVKETERWIIPFLKILKCNYFHSKITNECFKIQNQLSIQNYQLLYNKFHCYNKNKYKSLINDLTINFGEYAKRRNFKDSFKINIHKCTELETYNIMKDVLEVKSLFDVKQSYFVKLNINKLYFVFENNRNQRYLTDLVFNYLTEEKTSHLIKIIGYGIDDFTGSRYIVVEDNYRNKYQLYIFNRKIYNIYKNGFTENYDISYIDPNTTGNISTNYIRVLTRSSEIIYMPEGSTILDFAFRIHNDFGFACKGAYLNDAPTISHISTVLSAGDKVNLIIDKDEKSGLCNNIAQIRWIMYAKTEHAQKQLVRYFENNEL